MTKSKAAPPILVGKLIKLAESLSLAGKTTEAAAEFEVGANLLREQGRVSGFIKVGERLLFHRPGDMRLARDLAGVYLDRGNAKRALAKLQRCFKANPEDVPTLELLGRVFLVLRQQQKTICIFKEIARIHESAGRADERLETLRRIIELDPGDQEARQGLAAARAKSAASDARTADTQAAPAPGEPPAHHSTVRRCARGERAVAVLSLAKNPLRHAIRRWRGSCSASTGTRRVHTSTTRRIAHWREP